jgi:hypothetical protein
LGQLACSPIFILSFFSIFRDDDDDDDEQAFRDPSALGLEHDDDSTNSSYRELARKLLSQMKPEDALTRALALIAASGDNRQSNPLIHTPPTFSALAHL